MYNYGYSYPSGGLHSSAGDVFANAQYNLLSARVTADNGTLVDRNFTTNLYRLCFDQFAGVVPRRLYSAKSAVKLNDLGGGDVRVQVLYDLNNASPVDAIQTTAANQPAWSLDADNGFNGLLFDGSNDFMNINDLPIFNAQTAGTSIAVTKDLARTTGDSAHNVLFISTGATATVTRHGIVTRNAALNNFGATARKLDADTLAASTTASLDGYNFLANLSIWAANTLTLIANATTATAANFSSGGGVVSATDSLAFTIGAINATTNRLNGYIGEIVIDRTAFSLAQIAALRTFYKRYYPTLP
jgi:hypothetical protein